MEEIQNETGTAADTASDGAGTGSSPKPETKVVTDTKPKAAKKKASKKSKPAKASKAAPKKAKVARPTKSAAPETGHTLPPVGTEIVKKDRFGKTRCKCVVTKDGIRYKGKVYSSLSATAMIAASDLGLRAKALNGWTFWQLSPNPSATDPMELLQRLSGRYVERAKALLASASDENRSGIEKAVIKHADTVAKIAKGLR